MMQVLIAGQLSGPEGVTTSALADFGMLAETCLEQGVSVGIESQQRRLYGLQYHPEVMHSERGNQTLQHFLKSIAGLHADWKMENVLEEELEKIRRVVCSSSFPNLSFPDLLAKTLATVHQI